MKEQQAPVAGRAVPNVDGATLLRRYRNGELEAVWRDMVALGPAIRKEPYKGAAWAVAQETMRRAKYNIEMLVERLKQLDYRFLHEELVYSPCTKEEHKVLTDAERNGLVIPLSSRAFLEEVGNVDLLGSHPPSTPWMAAASAAPRG